MDKHEKRGAPSWITEWRGSKRETDEFIAELLFGISAEYELPLGERELRKLFCDALSLNGTKAVLASVMNDIYKEERE